jgi:hypothetical protein
VQQDVLKVLRVQVVLTVLVLTVRKVLVVLRCRTFGIRTHGALSSFSTFCTFSTLSSSS